MTEARKQINQEIAQLTEQISDDSAIKLLDLTNLLKQYELSMYDMDLLNKAQWWLEKHFCINNLKTYGRVDEAVTARTMLSYFMFQMYGFVPHLYSKFFFCRNNKNKSLHRTDFYHYVYHSFPDKYTTDKVYKQSYKQLIKYLNETMPNRILSEPSL